MFVSFLSVQEVKTILGEKDVTCCFHHGLGQLASYRKLDLFQHLYSCSKLTTLLVNETF